MFANAVVKSFAPGKGTRTPWGAADRSYRFAPGITFYTTPSHGGFHLSKRALAKMDANAQAYPTWAGLGWYEEDCDWAVVALAFPSLFPDEQQAAMATMEIAAGWEDRDFNARKVA